MSDRTTPIERRLAGAGLPTLPRLTWLEVDLSALSGNAATLVQMLAPPTRLAAVVKADGYGHGMIAAAHAALSGGAEMLAVATLDEALALRRAGFTARILVLYAVPRGALADAITADLDLVAMDDASVEDLAAILGRTPSTGPRPRIHLCVETGMTRGGFAAHEAVAAARRLLAAGLPALAGTWSHLAIPEDAVATRRQVEAFESALSALRGVGIDPGRRHLMASGGLLDEANPTYELVRVGLALYGHVPSEVSVSAGRAAAIGRLRPTLTLKARAASIETVPTGWSVGYGGSWMAPRTSRIATIALGYADGWTRLYAGAPARVRGHAVALVGRVGSDAVAVDVTDVDGFDPADELVLLSPTGEGSTVEQLADRRGSIPWEVLDDLAPRIARVYLEDGRPVATRYLDGRLTLAPGFQLTTATRTSSDQPLSLPAASRAVTTK